MLEACPNISNQLALNRHEKCIKNPCNGYKRLVHLMMSDTGRSIVLVLRSTRWINRVLEGKKILKIFKAQYFPRSITHLDSSTGSIDQVHQPSKNFALLCIGRCWPVDRPSTEHRFCSLVYQSMLAGR